jgi:cysteine desulfurase
MEEELLRLPGAFVVSAGILRLPNTLAVGFDGVPAARLVEAMSARGVMIGAGAACHSGEMRPSAVLTAMGMPAEQALCVTRLSTGWSTQPGDIDEAVAAMRDSLMALRA